MNVPIQRRRAATSGLQALSPEPPPLRADGGRNAFDRGGAFEVFGRLTPCEATPAKNSRGSVKTFSRKGHRSYSESAPFSCRRSLFAY